MDEESLECQFYSRTLKLQSTSEKWKPLNFLWPVIALRDYLIHAMSFSTYKPYYMCYQLSPKFGGIFINLPWMNAFYTARLLDCGRAPCSVSPSCPTQLRYCCFLPNQWFPTQLRQCCFIPNQWWLGQIELVWAVRMDYWQDLFGPYHERYVGSSSVEIVF